MKVNRESGGYGFIYHFFFSQQKLFKPNSSGIQRERLLSQTSSYVSTGGYVPYLVVIFL